MIIRIATPDDAGDLARMNAAFNGVSDSAAQIAARLVACVDIETAILGELDGQVGGFACVRVVPCVLYAEPYAELTELYVEPAFRRRGLGRALIAYAEQLAHARGGSELIIMTGVGNAAAQALYRAAGYDTYAVALNRKVSEIENRRTEEPKPALSVSSGSQVLWFFGSWHLMEKHMLQIETPQLRLVPCTVVDAQAAMADRAALEARLGARVPDDWPAEDLRDFLPIYGQIVDAQAAREGWGIWLMLGVAEGALVGDIGFKGPPDALHTAEIGYSVLPAFQGRGYASAAARAIVAWGLTQPGVRRIVANCRFDNAASIRVLEKAGLRQTGRDRDELTWEILADMGRGQTPTNVDAK